MAKLWLSGISEMPCRPGLLLWGKRESAALCLSAPDTDGSHQSRRLINFRGPVASPSCESISGGLPLKIRRHLDDLRAINVLECVYVEDSISNVLDHACYDWNHPARQANMKVCSLRPKPISVYLSVIGNPEMKPTGGMRGPGRPMPRAEATTASAGKDRRLGTRPADDD